MYDNEKERAIHDAWLNPINAVLSIKTDESVLKMIKKGYETDSFCMKLKSGGSNIPGVRNANGLWYVGNRQGRGTCERICSAWRMTTRATSEAIKRMCC
jgi:hypothetical protein